MDPKLIIEAVASPLIAGFVAVARLQNPKADAPALTQAVEGEIKHYLRGKISFGVDILWGLPQFKSDLDAEIASALAQPSPFGALTAPFGAGL